MLLVKSVMLEADHLIKKVVCHKIIGEVCSRLMTGKVQISSNNVLWKPPGGFHQDAAMMIGLFTNNDDLLDVVRWYLKKTGTLEYIKGSHKGLQPLKVLKK